MPRASKTRVFQRITTKTSLQNKSRCEPRTVSLHHRALHKLPQIYPFLPQPYPRFAKPYSPSVSGAFQQHRWGTHPLKPFILTNPNYQHLLRHPCVFSLPDQHWLPRPQQIPAPQQQPQISDSLCTCFPNNLQVVSQFPNASSTDWTQAKEALTTRLYLLTFCCSVISRKLKIFSMFWVRVCWISRRRWVGRVWKVTTSSASRRRMNITSSVWVSWCPKMKYAPSAQFKY